ncbi:MAG: hypothetical protein CMJ84_08960 [Planctomycetes bacterium]|nr:hypothetical protein [Planctomycetota bacterium]
MLCGDGRRVPRRLRGRHALAVHPDPAHAGAHGIGRGRAGAGQPGAAAPRARGGAGGAPRRSGAAAAGGGAVGVSLALLRQVAARDGGELDPLGSRRPCRSALA